MRRGCIPSSATRAHQVAAIGRPEHPGKLELGKAKQLRPRTVTWDAEVFDLQEAGVAMGEDKGLKQRVSKQSEDAIGKLTQGVLENPVLTGAVAAAFELADAGCAPRRPRWAR